MSTRSMSDRGANRAAITIERNGTDVAVTVAIRTTDNTQREVTIAPAAALPIAADRTEMVRLLGIIYGNALTQDGWA